MLLLFIIKNNSHEDYHYDNVRANVSMTLSHLPLWLQQSLVQYIWLWNYAEREMNKENNFF